MATKTEYSLELTLLSASNAKNTTFVFPYVKNNIAFADINSVANYMIENSILFNVPFTSLVSAFLITKTTETNGANSTVTISKNQISAS